MLRTGQNTCDEYIEKLIQPLKSNVRGEAYMDEKVRRDQRDADQSNWLLLNLGDVGRDMCLNLNGRYRILDS